MSKEGTEFMQDVRAGDLVRELTQDTTKQGADKKSLLPLRKARIWGKFDLKHRTIDKPVEIRNCEFEGEVDLRYCEFKQVVNLSGCTFQREFNSGDEVESHTIYKKDLICNKVTFERTARFNGARIEGSAYFNSARFLNRKLSVDLGWVSIEKALECSKATFGGSASFNALKCNGWGIFSNACFRGDRGANFAFAYFGASLDCTDATFEGPANFNSLKCDGSGFFNRAKFLSKDCLDFAFASFGINLECRDVNFAGPVDLSEVRVTDQFQLDGDRANLEQDIVLYQTTVGTLSLGDAFPLGKDSYADLRDIGFERFHGSKDVARELTKKQRPSLFSRDPYLQLEKHYSNIGEENEARKIYFEGRCAVRENAKDKKNGCTKWPVLTIWWSDWWLKWLTGYGVQTWRLLIPIFAVLVLGLVVFLPNNALEPVETESSPTQAASGEKSAMPTGEEKGSKSGEPRMFDRVAYNLDLYLPALTLGAAEKWEPQGLGREIYIVVHSVIGWLLIPLLIASLAGIIRRQ